MNSLCFQFELHCLGPVTHGQKGSVVHWTREDLQVSEVTLPADGHAHVRNTEPDSRLEPGPPDLEAGWELLSQLLPDWPVLMLPLPSTAWHTFFQSLDLSSLCPLVPRAKVQQCPVVPFVLG